MGQFTAVLGVVEVVIGVFLSIRHVWLLGSATGSGLTTPSWEPSLGGFPVLPDRGRQFLIRDVVLLGPSLYTAGDALGGGARRPTRRAGPSQLILAEGGGLMIPFGRRSGW